LLSDLETLTDLKLKDWTVDIEGDECKADEELIREKMILNPNEYKMEKETKEEDDEEELNEMRLRAGIDPKSPAYEQDEYIKNLKAIAGM
jgi:hypothetical protein